MHEDFIHTLSSHIQQIALAEQLKSPLTPFPILRIAEKNIAFHLIDLNTYQTVSAQRNCSDFFSELSTQFEQQGCQLVHIWEDVWRRQPQQVEARVAVLLGKFTRYHARQTEVRKITNPVLKDFLLLHHLQVPIGGRYKYGLFLKGELLAVASFSAVRPMNREGKLCNSYELLRFTNKTGSVVAGGLSKLLAFFVKERQPDDIMTYVDRDWGTGKGYRQLTFEQIGFLPPQQFSLDTATFERYYENVPVTSSNKIITVFNSGSYKFLKRIV